MRVFIKGQNAAIDLGSRNFIAAGGQGNVFARNGVGFKVYHDPSSMLPLGKIQELQAINDPRIVKPEDILVDKNGHPIGYTTKFIDDAYTLCQLFPRVFRERERLTVDTMKELIRKMRDGIDHVHQAKVLIVDLNEMNFLVDKKFGNVYFIDTDSYQTPHYPATAIMDSIRDPMVLAPKHNWNENTDWYSFGIVSFQMFTGIHPFKGRYKGSRQEFKTKLPTDADDDTFAVTRRRMAAGISVMHPEVGIPDAAYPLDTIPKGYKAWYEAMFTQGKRCPPPVDFGALVAFTAPTVTISATAKLDIAEIGSFDGIISGVWSDGNHLVVATDKGVWLDGQRTTYNPKVVAGVGFSPRGSRAVLADGTAAVPVLTNITDRAPIPFVLQGREVNSSDGRIYVRSDDRVHEVVLTDAGSQVIASTKEVVQSTPHATRLFPGVVVQNLLGSTFVSLLLRAGAALQLPVKELDKYKIIDAKFDHGVFMAIGAAKGRYDRIVIRFDDAGTADAPRIINDITPSGLNFVVLDSGVCVCLNEDEKLEIFSSKPGGSTIKLVDDSILGGDMILAKHGGTLLFGRGSKLYKMKMR